jgi:hypothetical protein
VLFERKRVSSIHRTCKQERSSGSSQNAGESVLSYPDIASTVGNRSSKKKKKKRGMSKRSVYPVKGSKPRSPIYTRSRTCLKLRHINGRKRLFPSVVEPLPALRCNLFNRNFKGRRNSLLSLQNSNASRSDIEKAIASQYDAENGAISASTQGDFTFESICTSDLDIETVGAFCEVNGFDGGPDSLQVMMIHDNHNNGNVDAPQGHTGHCFQINCGVQNGLCDSSTVTEAGDADATVGVGESNVDDSRIEIPLSDTFDVNGVGDSHIEIIIFCTSDLDIETVGASCEVGDSYAENVVRDSLTENIVGNSLAKIVGDCNSEIGVDNVHTESGTDVFHAEDGTGDSHSKIGIDNIHIKSGTSDSQAKIVHYSQEVEVRDFDADDGTDHSHSEIGVDKIHTENGTGDSQAEIGIHNFQAEAGVGDFHTEDGTGDSHSKIGVGSFSATNGAGDFQSEMIAGDSHAEVALGDSNPESGVHNSHAITGVGDCYSWFGICGLSEYVSNEDLHSVCGALGLCPEVDVSQSSGRENVKVDVAVVRSFQSEEGNKKTLQVPERQKLVSNSLRTKRRLSGRPYSLIVTRSMSRCVLRNKKHVTWLSPDFEYPLHARQSNSKSRSEGYKVSRSTSSRHKSYKDVFVQ